MPSTTKISLFIPTYNALTQCPETFKLTLETIARSELYRVLIIDSSSTDGTIEMVRPYGFEYKIIPKEDFNHGGTRQLGLQILSDSDIIIYLTQDAFIYNPQSFRKLTQVLLENNDVGGVYGRQHPHSRANIFAKHLRRFNYGEKSYITSYSDRYVQGMRSVFSSDSFAAYRVEALNSIGGFPDHVILGEDMYVFAKFLQAGYRVAYAASATCMHSHNYTTLEDFKRYFDIGVFHRSENWILRDFGTANKDGLKFIFSEWTLFLLRPWWWPKAILKTGAKYIGYKLGCNYDQLGVRLCRKFSMNKSFWW